MDYINTFIKNEKEVKTLIQTIRIYNQDIKMEFWIEKSAMIIRKKGKKEKEQKTYNRTFRKVSVHIEKKKTSTWQIRKVIKEYPRRIRKLLEIKLSSRNLIKKINTWVAISYNILWIVLKRENEQIDKSIWKWMSIKKPERWQRQYVKKWTKKGLTNI